MFIITWQILKFLDSWKIWKSKYHENETLFSLWMKKFIYRVLMRIIPVGIHLLKVNNRNTRTRCEMCSKLTIKKQSWYRSGVFIVNFRTYLKPCSTVSVVNFEQVNHFLMEVTCTKWVFSPSMFYFICMENQEKKIE